MKTSYFSPAPFKDYLGFNKPSGIPTHAVEKDEEAFVEWVSKQTATPLYVFHRLDKGTSGAILFAKTSEAAALIAKEFENHKVEKIYYFLTHVNPQMKSGMKKFEHSSFIEKQKNQFISKASKEPNAHTQFEYQKPIGPYHLILAKPTTGKPHQIRLHAQDLGFPILGDIEHGGQPFARLMLHAFEIHVPNLNIKHQIALPSYFHSEDEWKIPLNWTAGFERRTLLFGTQDSYRLLHTDGDPLRCDKLGNVLSYLWYDKNPPSEMDLDYIQKLTAQSGFQNYFLRLMYNRGEDPKTAMKIEKNIPETWTIEENGLKFEMRRDHGLSPGLFLDQRDQRNWVLQSSKDRRILNLYSYTSGFSVAAAQGGAKEVVSVDSSAPYLEWSKRNFELNHLTSQNYEFWAADSLVYLKGAKKRKRQFDLIVCDPPSLSRGKEGTFRLATHYKELLELCRGVLSSNGELYFSTNYEGWSQKDFREKMSQLKNFKVKRWIHPGLDFESTGENSILKGVILVPN